MKFVRDSGPRQYPEHVHEEVSARGTRRVMEFPLDEEDSITTEADPFGGDEGRRRGLPTK